jgi:hypothetical protein
MSVLVSMRLAQFFNIFRKANNREKKTQSYDEKSFQFQDFFDEQ